MDHFNAVKAVVTTGGTGNLTVSTTPGNKGRPLSTIPIGTSVALRFDDPNGTDWELSMCTILTATTLSRDTLLCGSNGTNKVALAVGTSVIQVAAAETLNSMLSAADVPFSTTIPLTRLGNSYMPQQSVTGAMTFTPAANAVRGALVYMRLVANGSNVPNFSAFKQWGGSSDYLNTSGIVQQIQFFYDGYDYWYSITQAVGATAVDVTPPTVSSASVANASPTIVTFYASETLDSNYVPAASAFAIGGHTASAVAVSGSTVSVTVTAAFANGEASRTAAYTQPATGGLRDLAGNLMVSFTGRAITNNVGVAATAPAQMAAPVATAGVASAGITLVAPSNGGQPITGYTVASTPAGGVDAAAGTTALTRTITGLTAGTSYTFKATATNSVGTSTASPSSNAVTPTAATVTPAQYPRVAGVTGETGTGPYSYPDGQAESTRRLTTPTMPGDGYFIFRQEVFAQMSCGVTESATYQNGGNSMNPPYTTYAVWSGSGNWTPSKYPNGVTATNSVSLGNTGVAAQGDWVRWKRVGTTLTVDISKNQGASWTLVYTWTGVTATLYPEVASKDHFSIMGGEGLV